MIPRPLINVGVMYYRRRLELALYRNKQLEELCVQLAQRVSELEKPNAQLEKEHTTIRSERTER